MITKLYAIKGMTCEKCVSRVKAGLDTLPSVVKAQVLLESGQAVVRMQEAIPLADINVALRKQGQYSALESNKTGNDSSSKKIKKQSSFLKIFRHKKPCCN